ncbi:MAG: hypothetical protein ACRC2R_11065 [Xenococcaceae cyanobacterium]
MSIKFTRLKTISIALAMAVVTAPQVMAQDTSHFVDNTSLDGAFSKAWLDRSGNTFHHQNMFTQLIRVVGLSYPEKEIAYNGKVLDIIYRDAIDQQVSSTPQVKTRDLKNPYDTSLLESGSSFKSN